jgi:hypothetical protein
VIRAVLDENLICRTFPLSVKPADVRIAPAEEFFMKPWLPAKSTRGGGPCPLDPSMAFSAAWSSPKREVTNRPLF